MNTVEANFRISPDPTKENKFLVPRSGFSRLDFEGTPLGLNSPTDHTKCFFAVFCSPQQTSDMNRVSTSLKQNKDLKSWNS